MMYANWARYYDTIYSFKDYSSEADRIRAIVREHNRDARTLLDVACGTGQHLKFLSTNFDSSGVEQSPEMLAVAQTKLRHVPLHQGSMETFDLGRTFDVVTCMFSSVAHVPDVRGLDLAVANMARHLAPAGVLIIEPWFTPQTYWTDTITANHAGDASLQIEWMYVSRAEHGRAILDTHFLIGTPSQIEHVRDRVELGLFTDAQYRDALRHAGLEAEPGARDGWPRGLYVATKSST